MADEIKDMKAGLKTRFEAVTGIKHVYTYPPDSINEEPAAVILLDSINNQRLIGGSTVEADFRVSVFVSSGDPQQSIDQLDSFASPLGTASVEVALKADTTLAGSADYAVLRVTNNQRRVAVGNGDFFVVDFLVRAIKAA